MSKSLDLRRVVVTGIGMVTPLGLDRDTSFDRALSGEGAVDAAPSPIRNWLPNALAACVDPCFAAKLEKNEAGLDKATQFALLASREALVDARQNSWHYDPERLGVFVGVGMGGATTIEALHTRFHDQLQRAASTNGAVSPTVVHPLSVPRLMPNAAAAGISIANQFRGPTHTYSVACASSAMAIGEAFRSIRHGYSDAIVAVGTEAMINPGSFVAWNALRAMAKPFEGNPAASCRPFDLGRTGFVLGEGAAALVLEDAGSAVQRGARIYAEVCGYGSSSDAAHLTQPSRDGQIRAMKMALDDSALVPAAIDYLNAHGTATEAGDVVESEAIQAVFGNRALSLPISSTKSLHGHLIGAAGAVELALTILSLRSGSIAPTAYLDNPDPRCPLDYVPCVARHGQTIRAALSNSFAFGGTNVSLAVRAFYA
jgi:3-oxoacyl-[acyl-carrier-protein] synthase II